MFNPQTKIMNLRYLLFRVFIILSGHAFTQETKVVGKVINYINNEPIPFCNVVIQGSTTGSVTDLEGNFVINNIQPGIYNFEASCLGFNKKILFEIEVTKSKVVQLTFALEESATKLEEVQVTASPFNKTEESPVSLRTIGVAEIQRAAGGNRDISRVIQNLPGVAANASFRNDIIIRGGAPNENRFYLDGVEVPNINHFATQGSSGGPVGLLNVNFINEVDYYAGAFPANRGNALSSVFEFKQKEGNSKKIAGNFMLGSSDIGLTLDGPTGKNSNFIFSVRRSYLQFLFSALKLPFLPTYNDYQYKHTFKLNSKNQISIISLGALDNFRINASANDGVTDSATLNRNNYVLGNIPINNQWNYTFGVVYKHFSKNSFQTIVLSRNMLNNSTTKYTDNDDTNPDNLLLNYSSVEAENKFRFENTVRKNGFKVNYGVNFEHVYYTNNTLNRQLIIGGLPTEFTFNSSLRFNKYGVFYSISKGLLNQRLMASVGLRSDFADYSSDMSNPLQQLSPRVSLSYSITEKWSLNFNTGRYFQLPAYTILGFRDANGNLVNKSNNIRYISVDHIVGGVEYNPTNYSKITVEGFYKKYNDYPFSLRDSISLANLGADFGVIGNEPVNSSSFGRSYGLEVLIQQKLSKGFYGIIAYTFVKSEFSNSAGKYIPSAWDFGHIINLSGGKKFKRNWELSMRFRLSGGAPYTPFDVNTSSLISVWNVRGSGVLDYDQLNTLRLPFTHQMDVRIDKRWYFNTWNLNVYFDVQNFYANEIVQAPFLDVVRDNSGKPLINPSNPSSYTTQLIENSSTTVLPTLGIMLEF